MLTWCFAYPKMANRYGRQARLSFLLVGGLLVGPFTSTVDAQPGDRRDRVELLAGAGKVWEPRCVVIESRTLRRCTVLSRETYEVGAALWWSDHWGLVWRYDFAPGTHYFVDPRRSVVSVGDEVLVGARNPQFHTVTVHYRQFGAGGMVYELGFGTMSESVSTQQSHSGPALEVFVGRHVFQRIGFKVGVTQGFFLEGNGWRTRVGGFAVLGFGTPIRRPPSPHRMR